MAKRLLIVEYDDTAIEYDAELEGVLFSRLEGMEYAFHILVPFGDVPSEREQERRVELVKESIESSSVPAPEEGENG